MSIVEESGTHHIVSYYKLVVSEELDAPFPRIQTQSLRVQSTPLKHIGLCEKTMVLTQSCA